MEEVSTLTGGQTKQEPGYDIPLKKSKMDESQLTHYLRELYSPATLLYQFSQLSRQQPWLAAASPKHIITPFGPNVTSIPYLSSTQEPPILQNPERVVRHTENERFDRSYQPNVALAPRQTILAKEREREQREFEKERENNERSSTVIKRETIQIKQERPSTPIAHESPELRHNSPETTVVLETTSSSSGQQEKMNVTAPISPEGQSGSNEITSSTSPVPATPSMIPNKQESISPPHHHHTTSPRSHHLHHHTMISSHHHHLIHKTSSTSSASPPTVVVKVTTNHQMVTPLNGLAKKVPIIGNPEFELSTDTDDESLGEPDSSNHNGSLAQTPYEFAANLLKNNSTDDHIKILDLIKYMEKEITQLKEAHKKEIRERQHIEETLRKENERLQNQLNQQHKLSVIANASCLSTSSSSSSSSLSSNSSFDFEHQQQRNGNNNERRNSIVAAEKPNVIIKPPKKSLLRITPLLENDCKPTANNNNNSCSNSNNNINNSQSTTTTTPSIVIMPKCEDIINNNNTKIYNNNNNNNSTSTTTTTVVINGQQTESSSGTDDKINNSNLQKTTIKAEKL